MSTRDRSIPVGDEPQQPDLPGIPPKPKTKKAVAQRYFVTEPPFVHNDIRDESGTVRTTLGIVPGSESGFRTRAEVAAFARTLPEGTYLIAAIKTQPVVITEVKSRKIKGV